MKKIALAALLVTFSFFAFAKGAKHKKKATAAPANDIEFVSLRHTACYGRCPVYTISVNKNGIATYTATLFNLDTGVFTKNIGEAKALSVIDRFNTARVDTCQDKYTSRVTDIPGTVFTIKYKNTTKMINDASAGPVILTKLAAMMDSIVSKKLDKSWHKVTENPK